MKWKYTKYQMQCIFFLPQMLEENVPNNLTLRPSAFFCGKFQNLPKLLHDSFT